MVSAHHAVARVHGGAFNDRQDIALHTLARNIGPMAALAAGNLVHFIEEDDAGIFDPVNGDARHLIHVNQALLFFLDQILESLIHFHLPLLGALPKNVGQHVLQVYIHLLHTLVGDDFKGWKIALADVNFYHALVELALAQLLPQLFAGTVGRFSQPGVAINDHAAGG